MDYRIQTFLWGSLGSLAVEVFTLLDAIRSESKLPARYTAPVFWVVRALIAMVAGSLAVAYGVSTPILAIHVGASTPLILAFFTKSTALQEKPKSRPRATRAPRE
jgi:fatty acid desaturase